MPKPAASPVDSRLAGQRDRARSDRLSHVAEPLHPDSRLTRAGPPSGRDPRGFR